MLVISVGRVFLKMHFNVGDEVISADGYVGKIISICDCDRCKQRGFYEPVVEWEDGNVDWITDWEQSNNFRHYYKIGNYVFGNTQFESVKQQITDLKDKLHRLEKQRDVLSDIIEIRENNLE